MICSKIINKEAGRTDARGAWLENGWKSHVSGFWSYCSLSFASISLALVFMFPVSRGGLVLLLFFIWLLGIMLAFFLSCLMLICGRCEESNSMCLKHHR